VAKSSIRLCGYIPFQEERMEVSLDQSRFVSVVFPSTEATEQHRDDATSFSNFKQDVEEYFPNFNGVIGKAFYAGDHLQDLSIDIPIQFYGKTEGIGFTQFVTGKVMEHFPDYISVEVNVSSVNGPEALIVKEVDQKEPFVHIYH